jgi:hypothetical protein
MMNSHLSILCIIVLFDLVSNQCGAKQELCDDEAETSTLRNLSFLDSAWRVLGLAGHELSVTR